MPKTTETEADRSEGNRPEGAGIADAARDTQDLNRWDFD